MVLEALQSRSLSTSISVVLIVLPSRGLVKVTLVLSHWLHSPGVTVLAKLLNRPLFTVTVVFETSTTRSALLDVRM